MTEKLGLENIENGWLVTRPSGKIFESTLDLAIQEMRLALDSMEKELRKTYTKEGALRTPVGSSTKVS